jgi:phosphatidate cytidylyltransferase
MKNFLIRLASGVTVAVLIIAAILASRISYGIVVLIAAVGGVYEFYTITAGIRGVDEASNKRMRRTAVMLTIIALLLSWLFHFRYRFDDIAILLTGIFFFYFVKELFSKSDKPFQNIAWNIVPFVYVVLPVMILNYFYFEKGAMFALAILFLIWFYDSMCYITGSLFGKHKLFERISPQKTIEGMVGGMILSLIFVFFFDKILAALTSKFPNDNWFSVWTYTNVQWLAIGFVTLIFATLGDLVESMLKRSIGIKDSGVFLPGHGGFLDRLDAILIALPFTLLIVFAVDRVNDVLLLIDFLK